MPKGRPKQRQLWFSLQCRKPSWPLRAPVPFRKACIIVTSTSASTRVLLLIHIVLSSREDTKADVEVHAGTAVNEVTKEDALEDDKAKEADLFKHKIKEMDTSIKLLMKQVAESNAKGKTITRKKQGELTDEHKLQEGEKKQKELTNEQEHQVV